MSLGPGPEKVVDILLADILRRDELFEVVAEHVLHLLVIAAGQCVDERIGGRLRRWIDGLRMDCRDAGHERRGEHEGRRGERGCGRAHRARAAGVAGLAGEERKPRAEDGPDHHLTPYDCSALPAKVAPTAATARTCTATTASCSAAAKATAPTTAAVILVSKRLAARLPTLHVLARAGSIAGAA